MTPFRRFIGLPTTAPFLLLLPLLGACIVVEGSGGDSARSASVRQARNANGEAAAAPRDSLTALGARTSDRTVPTADAPSLAELETLRTELTIPVVGVKAADLRDSFDEARGSHPHQALDIPAPRGTPVRSAADGRVLKLFDSKAGGLMVYAVDASERFILMYGHLDAYASGLRDGAALRQGDAIGVVGTTGNAPPTVPHLHFAIAHTANPTVWWMGMPVNPYPLLTPR